MRCLMIPDHADAAPTVCNRCSPFCPWFYQVATDRQASPDELRLADLLDVRTLP
jgi:hypothetical protein